MRSPRLGFTLGAVFLAALVAGPPAAADASAAPPAMPRAAYVITPGVGFRVGPQGRAIGNFVLPVRCAGRSFRVARIPIADDGRFRFEGSANGVTIVVSGRFPNRRSAVGQVAARGPGCPRLPVRFVARLS